MRIGVSLRVVLAVTVLSLLFPAFGFSSDTLTLTLFGPEAFFRDPSGPVLRNFTVPSTQGTFTLTLKNGDDAGNNKISSATVKVNGATIARQSDFNQQVVWIIKPLTNLVPGSNTLSVEVSNKSSTSSFVTATITGDYLLNVTITVPASGSGIFSDRVEVSGTYASYTSNIGISVNGVGAQASTGTFSAANVPLLSGSNMITATIATSDGIQDNDTITVTANRPPAADAGPDRLVPTGQTVVLDGRNSSDPENDLITYAWSFTQKPFGSASVLDNATSVNPSFVPDLNGIYIASLVVNDGHSNSAPDSVTTTAEPPNTPPTANAGPDQSVVTGTQVYLDGRASFDPEVMPLYYSWSLLSFPTGSTAAFDAAASAAPSFIADLDGNYLAELIVNDGVHNSLPDNVLITAATPNAPPVAYAGPDNTVLRTDIIYLDGTGSYDPDNNALLFSWNIVSRPAGSISELDDTALPTPSLPADQEGDYVVRLTVNDGLVDSAPDTVVINSINAVPVADAGPDQTVPRNTSLTLDGSGSSDANNDPLTYAWSILSAPAGSTATIGNPTAVNPLVTPDQAGVYNIRLMVNDGHGGNAQDNVTIAATAPSVTVPNVVGTPQISAESAITGTGLTVGNITQAHSATVPAGNVISQSPAGGSTAYEGSYVDLTVSLGPVMVSVPNVAGMTQAAAQSAITAIGLTVGAVTQDHSLIVPAGSVMSQSPVGGASVPQGSAVDIVVSTGPGMVSVPHVLGMPQAQAQASITGAGLAVGTVMEAYSETVVAGYVITENPAAGVSIIEGSVVSLTMSLGPAPIVIPPDPSTVAPPIDRTVATDMLSATSFLYMGANPIQTGVSPGMIELTRAAVVRGQVRAFDNTFLSGVKITVLNHPEFGQTASRIDGMFDMAVNGGGLLTFVYRKSGYISIQRQVDVPWQGFAAAPDVVMIPYDNQVTFVDFSASAPVQVAGGSVVTDSDGTRKATLFFSQGTQASLVFSDNSIRTVPSLSVRATEYTAGPNGPNAMPAQLPPTTGYTYCVELSADEAVAAGAKEVRFSQPVPFFVENFLNFPVGEIVPVGFYDNEKGTWVASNNGKVVKILGINGGMVDLDTNGDGAADNATLLSALGVTDAERTELAGRYAAGTSLWRMPISHFSRPDANFPTIFAPGQNVVRQNLGDIITDKDVTKACTRNGSIIECENQTLGQVFEVAGTPFSLNYRSNRVEGRTRSYAVTIPLSKGTIPSGLLRIDLEIEIAGRRFTGTFPAVPNQSYPFEWDGLDVYGRELRGKQNLKVRVGYVYRGVYMSPADGAQSFGRFGDAVLAVETREEITIWQTWEKLLGTWEAMTQGLGGFTLNIHHAYNPASRTLSLGEGTSRTAEDMKKVLSTVAGSGEWAHYHNDPYNGTGWSRSHWDFGYSGDGGSATLAKLNYPTGVAVGADGSVYIADTSNNVIRRVGPDGIISTVAGTGVQGFSGDGGLATQARLGSPSRMVVGPDGSLYFLDQGYSTRIRKVSPDGIITTFAGNGGGDYSGNNVPATQVGLYALDLAVGPEGNLYIFHVGNGFFRIRRVGTDGIISTIASVGGWFGGLATGPDGSVYYGDSWIQQVKRIGTDGQVTVVAGGGSLNGDGIPATQASLNGPRGLSVGPDGTLYFTQAGDAKIRKVSPDGIITTVAGTGGFSVGGDGAVATQAALLYLESLALGPDGTINFTDAYSNRVRRVGPPLPGLSMDEISVASENGGEVFVFRGDGKHLRTLNAINGTVSYRFDYDAEGRLSGISDADNNVTAIERDGNGNPTAIVAPGGQRTVLSPDPNGYLETITDPAGNTRRFFYTDKGLMTSYTDPDGNPHAFVYDTRGLLVRDEDPEGGFLSLDRTETATGFFVTAGTALGRATRYEVRNLSTGAEQRINTFPTGAHSTLDIGVDGKRTSVLPDSTITEVVSGPDPRFGMTAPLPSSYTVRTPGGHLSTTTLSRATPLSNASDLLSLISQTDNFTVNGNLYRQIYNASQKQFTLTTPMNRTQIAGIDNQGRVLRVNVAPTVDNVTFGYDSKGRLAQTGQGGRNWIFGYDGLNRLTSVSDPLTHSVQYGYDDADRVSRVILPSGRTFGFGYDPNGNRTSITMPSGAVHGLGYNKVNLDNAYVPPNNPAYGTQYNLDREWVRTTLPTGRAIDGGYDNGGRITATIYPEGAVTLSYFDNTDRVGTLTRTVAPVPDNTTQTIAFSYDGFLTTRVAFSGVANGEYRYSFDNNFRVMSVALDNVWTTLARDNDGLLTGYGPFTITRTGPAGAPSALTDNTLNISYTYDSSGRLYTRTHTVAAIPVYQFQLGYDNVGCIAQKIETVSGTAHTFDYTYDVDGQLFEVRKDGALVEQYGYDNNANRTSTLTASASYDYQDRLIQQAGVNYNFDDDGYLTTRGSDTFTYSARGELLSATVSGQTFTYQYDGMARRIARTDATGTVQYLYGNPGNPFQVTASRDGARILTTYFYDTAGNLFAFDRGGQRYYVATDHLGTPKVVTDGMGNVVKAVEYDAWGVMLSDSNPTFDLPVAFAGGIADGATGLVRFGWRDYEPATGRWAAKDPISFLGGDSNLYRYVRNDSVGSIDPQGLKTFGGRVNLTFIFADVTIGLVFDDKGNYALQFTPAVGLSLSAGVTGGVTWTDAPCIKNLEGFGTTAGAAVNVPGTIWGGEVNRVWTGLPNQYSDPNVYKGLDAGIGIGIGLRVTPQEFTGYTGTIFQGKYK
jgi:RHS repeat-associated protein